jgi:hypothetical protein
MVIRNHLLLLKQLLMTTHDNQMTKLSERKSLGQDKDIQIKHNRNSFRQVVLRCSIWRNCLKRKGSGVLSGFTALLGFRNIITFE